VSKGVCVGAKTLTLTDKPLGATDPLVVGNTVDGSTGKVEIGMYVAIPAPHATIIENTVRHASLAGIRLNNQSLESTTVTSNAFIENRFGLALVVMPGIEPTTTGHFFGSSISLNDFVGSTRQAIATGVCKNVVTTSCETNADCGGTSGPCLTHTMAFPAELSVDGQGNYWGRACSDSDGFRAADEPDALGGRDTSAPNVVDSHPYGVSVAGGVGDTTLTCH
jgi:nitrous oxidase accessory protein NosD